MGVQNTGGSALYSCYTLTTKPSIQLLNIIRNYYSTVKINKSFQDSLTGINCNIIAEDFRGIDDKEYDELLKLVDILYKVNPKVGRELTNYKVPIQFYDDDNFLAENPLVLKEIQH